MKLHVRILVGLAAIIAIAFAPTRSSAQTLDQANAFVRDVYDHYQRWAAAKSPSAGQSFKESAVYSPALIDLMRKDNKAADGEVGYLDYDPICNCQDFDGLKVAEQRVIKTGEQTATGSVALKYAGEPRVVKIDLLLVWTASGWRIDDIKTSDTPSLQAALKQSTIELLKLKASQPAASRHPPH